MRKKTGPLSQPADFVQVQGARVSRSAVYTEVNEHSRNERNAEIGQKVRFRERSTGFTLIELLIALAIVTLIGLVAFPSYQSYVRKSNRSEAVSTLLKMQLAEEQYRANHSQYGTLAQVWGGVSTTTSGRYTLAISNVSATSYTLTATAQGAQASDTEGSTACTTLTLTVTGASETKSPTICWE